MMFRDSHDMQLDDRDPNDGKEIAIDKVTYIIRKDPMHVFWYLLVKNAGVELPEFLQGKYTTLGLLNKRIEAYRKSPEIRAKDINSRKTFSKSKKEEVIGEADRQGSGE